LWLDPVLKGKYPSNALTAIQRYNPSFQPSAADMQFMADNKPDFLGVNFYAPAQVKHDDNVPMGVSWLGNNTDKSSKATDLCDLRNYTTYSCVSKNEYNNIPTIITENWCKF
jgi:beta-glucosidase